MAGKFQGKSLCLFIVGLLVFAGTGLNEVRAADGDQIVTGVVTEMGHGSFILRTETKENRTFNTGRETKYEPADFRAREGDEVEVTFYDKDLRGRIIQAVSHLKLIKLNPDFQEPANPAIGTIKEAGRRAYNIYIPEIKLTWNFELARGWKAIPKGWKPAADDQVKVTYKKVPARWTSRIVYQILTIEKM
jgi:hypothetical protein